jgi:hypothetical protein
MPVAPALPDPLGLAQNATLVIFDLRSGSAAAVAIIATSQFQTGHTR